MNSFNPLTQNSAVNGLITAISRNTEDGVLSRHLGAQSWYIVADYLRPHTYERGHLLISQGAQDRNLYFLETGNLKVDVKTDSGLMQLAILGPGTVVGEGSFFSHLPRAATVQAASNAKVWCMTPLRFTELANRQPGLALETSMALGTVLARRLVNKPKRIAVT